MFYSILFPTEEKHKQPRQTEMPACFKDLRLDQIFSQILMSKKEFELDSFYFTALSDIETIIYRQEILKELEDQSLYALFMEFSRMVNFYGISMSYFKEALSEDSLENNYLTKGRFVECADQYLHYISALSSAFSQKSFSSKGLSDFASYISEYCRSAEYNEFRQHITRLREKLAEVDYCMLIKNDTVRVRKYEGQADHTRLIADLFDRFRQADSKEFMPKLPEIPHAPHVEAAILNMVAGINKDAFEDLDNFCKEHINFMDETVTRFAREIQFYLAWLENIIPARNLGLQFNCPKLSDTAEQLYSYNMFDLALALTSTKLVVTNDFVLEAPERIMVITGPNQGGKTTFARAFGQAHWLASLGLCVPGTDSKLFMFDNILTHFSVEEDLSTLNGKLQDDLVRLCELLKKATSRSIIIINEIFTSTTLKDALTLGGYMMDDIAALGAIAVCVTFLDELAYHGEEAVSLMSTVEEDDPTKRKYKIIRKPPDGLAYALHIAGKYGLTYEKLCGRLEK